MGNTASNDIPKVSSSGSNTSEEDQLIDQVLEVSKELLSKYNQEFLREDFCFDMGIVIQESLEKLSIPVLQDMGNRVMKDGETTSQMKMIMQYSPKGDEKFFVEGFEKQLEDYFWNQPLKMNSKILEKEGLDSSGLQLFVESNKSPQKFSYIDITKINELLRDAQYKSRYESKNQGGEENVEVSNEVKSGGANLQNFRRELNMALSEKKKNSNIAKLQKKKVNIVENEGKNENAVNVEFLRESLKNGKTNQPKVNQVLNQLENEIKKKNEENRQTPVKVNRQNIKNTVNQMVRNNISVVPVPAPVSQNKVSKNEVSINLTSTNENSKNRARKNEVKKPNRENSMVQYRTRKDYEKPSTVCMKGVEKCSMTKKDLCKVIADNLIIRSNIVAAILTVLPNRKSKTGYYGGYLYSKFINLGKCQVCVPYNYKDLMDKNPVDLIKQVVHYSDFTDYKSCKDNGGYYMKLSKTEMEALYANVPEDGKVKIGKQMNYNAFYVECAKKLKDSYFGNLKVLLEILESLRSQPIINNVALNELGNKTREIIDSMYHLCQYYYIYAIVSILHANLSVAKSTDIELQKTLARSLKKNSSSESS
jgi:hypothetical protein